MIYPALRPSCISGILYVVFAIACARQAPSIASPEELRKAYAQALVDDDPDQAYALLSPELQTLTPRSEFRKNWKARAKERTTTLQEINLTNDLHQDESLVAKTWFQGRQLIWKYMDGEFWLVGGLPQFADTSTPEGTLRSLVAALRKVDLRPLEYVFSDTLHHELHSRWRTRADDIETALNERNRLQLSETQKRAVLHYGVNRSITLQRNDKQWRIIRMD